MSIILPSILILLLIGSITTYLVAGRRENHGTTTAIVVVSIALIGWLVANRGLPLSLTLIEWSQGSSTSQWLLLVDKTTWQMSFYLLLFIEAILLTQNRFNSTESDARQSSNERLTLPIILSMTAISLLTLWSASMLGLVFSWTLLALIWLVFLWIHSTGERKPEELLPRAGFLLLGVAFLLLSVAFFDDLTLPQLGVGSWPKLSLLFAFLAALTQLGSIPLHWWRPLNWTPSPSIAALVHLLPSLAGASLLVHLLATGNSEPALAPIIPAFGLLGLLLGTGFAAINRYRLVKAVAGLVIAQIGLIVLASRWVNAQSIVAASGTLLLAVGTLYLANGVPKQRLPWYSIVPFAALAGLPLTAGFILLAPMYTAWLSDGQLLLLMATVILIVPFVAFVARIASEEHTLSKEASLTLSERIRINVGLLLPAIGLIVIPSAQVFRMPVMTWVLILLPACAGLVLSRYGDTVFDLRPRFHQANRFNEYRTKLQMFLASTARGIETVLWELRAIIEGEGGMLFLLVMIVVIWLVRSG